MNESEIKKFTKLGFLHEFVQRIGEWSIYKRSKNDVEHFEVVKLRTATKDAFMGDTLVVKRGSIMYPSNGEWGSRGFTAKTLEQAIEKANQLIEQEKQREQKRKEKTNE